MIEIIYSTNEQKGQSRPPKLPKNVVQIGVPGEKYKVYIEEKTEKYLNQLPVGANEVAFGVLLGDCQVFENTDFVFVNGLVSAKPTDNMVDFNEKSWAEVYEDMHTYFPEKEIVGWYLSIPYRIANDKSSLLKIHLDNFGGEGKICYFSDRKEQDTQIYHYEDGGMKGEAGYYIYQDANQELSAYLEERGLYGLKVIYPTRRMPCQAKHGEAGRKNKSKFKKVVSLVAFFSCVAAIVTALTMIWKYGDILKMNQSLMQIAAYEQEQESETEAKQEEKWTGKTQVEQVDGTIKKARPDQTYYTVKKGETLFDICIRIYNDAGMLEQLKVANNIDDDYTIHEGDKILLP